MIETKTKVIDGLTFMSTQLPPLKAYPLSVRVAGIVLPLFARLSKAGISTAKAEEALQQDITSILPALEPLFEALGSKENEDLPQKLLAGTTVQVPDAAGDMTLLTLNTPEAINRAFEGRGITLWKAMWFAVEVNFRDFIGGASKGAQTKATDEAPKASA